MSVREWPQEIRERRGAGELSPAREAILLCGGEDFRHEARRELLRKRPWATVLGADGFEEARALLERDCPHAVLAEEVALIRGSAPLRERHQSLAAALSLLAANAPVVWIGGEEDAREVASLLPSLEADFVPRSPLSLPAAVTLLERRLRLAGRGTPRLALRPPVSLEDLALDGRNFGEVLRHELNNPLTGILGNAELLLLEVRRGRLELPAHNVQRLEVIADLAVRMREAVRQLSDRWIAAGGAPGGEKQTPSAEPHGPLSG